MSILHCRLSDIPDTYGWDGLFIVITQAPETSALNRALNPDLYAFSTSLKQSAMIADLLNSIAMFRYEFASANSKHKPKKPQLYPTPWTENNDSEIIGKGSIPVSQFDDWYYSDISDDTDSDE